MNDLGNAAWAPPPFPVTHAERPPARRRRWPFFLLALVVLAAGSLAAVVWLREEARAKAPDHPNAWDPRVLEYVEVVEDERDLDFKHPVHVDFLSVKDFTKEVTEDEEDLSDEDREEIRQTTGLFRALGLVEGDVDLFETMNQLAGAGILGYYSDEDERIKIRGTKLTPAVQSTLVHELTHALQDQHFDIGRRMADLDKSEKDSAAAGAFKALVEGDASRIETAWQESLPPKKSRALEKSEAGVGAAYEKDAAEVPDVLETMMASPYVFGEALLDVTAKDGGERAVDALFAAPPTTEEHQLDPWGFVEDRQRALDVSEPSLAEGEKEFDSGPFGALSWMLVLAERIPVQQALTAADGWGGDAYVGYERDGATCARIGYRADTPQDLDQMHRALTTWVGRLPDGPASVRRDGAELLFESCDPGPKAAGVATGGSRDAVGLAVGRTYLSLTLVDSGFSPAAARCGADRLVREFTAAELNSDDVDPSRVQRVLAPCRA